MPQNQEKKRIPRYEARFTNKNHPFMWLVCKIRAKILFFDPETSLTTPHLLPWGDRDDHMETTNRPCRPDRLEIFWNDWGDRGDRDDPDDHMETRLFPLLCFMKEMS